MNIEKNEQAKKRTRELLEIIATTKNKISSMYKDNPSLEQKKIKNYMQTPEYTEIRKEIIELNLDYVKTRVIFVTKGNNEQYLSYAIDGLAEAIDKFDISKGLQLLTYATSYIDVEIKKGMQQENFGINIGNEVYRKITNELKNASDDITAYDISKKTGISLLTVVAALKALDPTYSLDASITPESSYTNADVISDNCELPDETVYKRMLIELLGDLINTKLNEREEQVIRLRYGIGENAHTYDEIGKMLGITKEGVRKIEKKARQKISEHIPLYLYRSAFEENQTNFHSRKKAS